MLARCRCSRLPYLRRNIVTAATAHAPTLERALQAAISETTALHHGFTSNDMPAQALLLISRAYFPMQLDGTLAQYLRKTMTAAVGEHCQVASVIVDAVGSSAGVSMLVASEEEGAKLMPLHDPVDRQISLGRAWKAQGTVSEADNWQLPEDASWQSLLSDGGAFERATTTQAPQGDATMQVAIVAASTGFAERDWPAQLFPKARRVGLLASATPFLTGLPVTMTFESEMIGRGGWALGFPQARSALQVAYPTLHKLGEPLLVTKCQGNILITLNEQPATYCLLEQIRTLSLAGSAAKDLELYGQVQHGQKISSTTSMIKIISGDPGKGSMALNGGYHVSEGDSLQLFRSAEEEALPSNLEGTQFVFEKLPVDRAETYADAQAGAEDGVERVSAGVFAAGSERGLVVGGAGSRGQTWVSEVPGCQVTAVL